MLSKLKKMWTAQKEQWRYKCVPLVVAFTIPSVGLGADIRDCRLDSLTFLNSDQSSYVGEQFKVERVGETWSYWCDDNDGISVKTDTLIENAYCQGPFGSLLLEGTFDGTPNEMTVIWSVASALPCCEWYAYPTSQIHMSTGLLSDVDWFPKGAAPTLGRVAQAALIETSRYSPLTLQLLPLVCDHDLP